MSTGAAQTDEQEARKVRCTTTPLGVPWIAPADVAPVVFLASDAARMVSGTIYDVTGGVSPNNAA